MGLGAIQNRVQGAGLRVSLNDPNTVRTLQLADVSVYQNPLDTASCKGP